MNTISLHNVVSVEISETGLRDSHINDDEHYAVRDIVITDAIGNRMTIALFTGDSAKATEVLEALQPTFKFN